MTLMLRLNVRGYESLIKFWLRSCAVVDGCLVSLNDTSRSASPRLQAIRFSPSGVLSSLGPSSILKGPEMSSIANNFPVATFRCRLRRWAVRLPVFITLLVVVAMLAHGVIVQPVGYHDFADHSQLAGLPHAADVLSIWASRWWACGVGRLAAHWQQPSSAPAGGLPAFLIGLMLTAVGSAYYHLAPDDFRLVWDRLPIALACAGLIAAVRGETVARFAVQQRGQLLALFAVASVGWWHFTNGEGAGDLRPLPAAATAPIVLIPLWQWLYGSDRRDRLYFGAALAVYVLAKGGRAERSRLPRDERPADGHTLKHLLATLAAWLIVARLCSACMAALEIHRPAVSRLRMPAS